MQELDEEFPRLTKLREARAARLARQCKTNNRSPAAVEKSPTSVVAAFNVNTTTFVQDKYDDVCRRVSHIDHDIEDLLTRGTYLAQQTVLDAEAHHKSAYGLYLMKEVETFECEEDTLNFENNVEKKEQQTNSKRAKTQQVVVVVGDEACCWDGTDKKLYSSSDVVKNLLPLFHQKDYCTIHLTELLFKRKTATLRQHFFFWKKMCVIRQYLRVRLKQSKQSNGGATTQAELDRMWLGVHHDVGNDSYHPEEICKRDGKFCMAKEYQNNRMKKCTFGRWMMKTCLWLTRREDVIESHD